MNKSTKLVEQSADWRSGARVDRAARLVRNVALAGPASRNGYRYAESALRDGASLYDGKPVFLDHARDPRRPQERSTRDLVGSIVEPRFETGRIRGDIEVLETEAGQTFLSLVESDAPGVGMSHVVLADRDGTVVERIRDVISVDAVIGPATTTTFRESTSGTGESDDSVAAGNLEGVISEQQRELETLRQERDSLAARLSAFEEQQHDRERSAAVQRVVTTSKLPDYAVSPLFLEQLAAADDASREQLIAERRELISRSAATPPLSASRRDSGEIGTSRAFVAAIRGGRTASVRQR